MDSTTEKQCLEEISTLVFDSLEKVTLKMVSNNWLVQNTVVKDVFIKWLEMNAGKRKELSIEYLIRGYNTRGVFSFSVVSEERKDVLESKWKNFGAWIYSIEMRSNARKLDLPDWEPIKVKNIRIDPGKPRNLSIPIIPEPVKIKEEHKTIKATPKTPFSSIKPAAKSETKTLEDKKEVKPSTVVKSPEKETKSKEEIVKTEKTSPEDGKTKAAAGKKAPLKNQKPVQKGSISSFFSNNPSSSKPAVVKPKVEAVKPKVEAVKPKVEAMLIDEDISEDEVKIEKAPKRQITPVKKEEPAKKKAVKKIKLKEPANKKRSRIVINHDSSEDEEEANNDSDEPETKFIKFDRELTPDRDLNLTQPTPNKESPEKEPEVEKGKRKAKRLVKKRFQTDDGFMRTENVLEEYSVSEGEGENDENKKKNSPQNKKAGKKEVEKKSTEKKISPDKKKQPAVKPTQTSKITSFFTKK